MRNLFKKWTLIAAVLGMSMFSLGCLGGRNMLLLTAWLNEDAFG